MEHKTCSKCNEYLELKHFYKHSKGKFGVESKCKSCCVLKSKTYYRRNILAIKQYQQDNKALIASRRKSWNLNKLHTDIQFKLKNNLRRRLRNALKGDYKKGSAVELLGCSVVEFKQYLESKFQVGMSWENYGKWHIDHIIPLSSVDLTDFECLRRVCHYSNLQPLWAIDNIRKRGA